MTGSKPTLEMEAEAFNQRIRERVAAGFVADLRRTRKCEYFYKSFWRDPYYIHLFVREYVDRLIELVRTHGGEALEVLDVGCGPGYGSLEFARAGYRVTAIDIADAAIEVARETLAENPFREGFGSLDYHVSSFESWDGSYDVVVFCGSLHHFEQVEAAVGKAREILRPGGLLVCYEPCHERWQLRDAAQVAVIRELLSLAGLWYETPVTSPASTRAEQEERLNAYIEEVHREYVQEHDPNESAQSPHDNASSGEQIIAALGRHFVELDSFPGCAFIHRLLGGMRGEEATLKRIADFLNAYDRLGVKEGFLNPNAFFFAGRRKD